MLLVSGEKLQALCDVCGTDVPYAACACVGCGADVGYPNVRAANTEAEIAALRNRLKSAQATARARGVDTQLEEFGTEVNSSRAVMVRHLAALQQVVEQDNQLFNTYHQQRNSLSRLPSDNVYDQNRIWVESLVNRQNVHEHIHCAALSLNQCGPQNYGNCHVTLKDIMIESRSSVFEKNPFDFCEKHAISATGSLPVGYRATWKRRSELAMAKLQPRIAKNMTVVDYPAVLMEQDSSKPNSDFIEVHIYGPIHKRAIEHVKVTGKLARPDALIWRRMKRKLEQLSVTFEEV